MATCCISQTGAIFELLAISKPCIRFRWSLYRFQSKSSHLLLDFQVEARFMHLLSILAYASHPAYHTMFMCWLFTMLCASFRCCFFGLVPITSRLWGSVRLCPFVFFMDLFLFLAGSQARWSLPSISLLSLLASCSSIAMPMLRYHHLLIMPPKLPC